MALASEEHDRAERLLSAARVEEHRLSESYEAAVGTPGEMAAQVELRAATTKVAAHGAWLNCVDTEERHITTQGVRSADEPVSASEAWLRWVDEKGHTGRDAGDVARLRRG
jgi:hypothetical protein